MKGKVLYGETFHSAIQKKDCLALAMHYVWYAVFLGKKFAVLYQRVYHPQLADLAAPIGSQEVVDHTHKWWQLIGQHLPVCMSGPQVSGERVEYRRLS